MGQVQSATSKMRSPGRPSSTVLARSLAPATQPCAATMPAAALRLVLDVPLPHDPVGDLIPLGLLSHTLYSSSAVPRPRIHLRLGTDVRNPVPHHHDASAFITAICPRPQPPGTWQIDWNIHRSHRHLHFLDTDGSFAATHGCHGADKAPGRLGSPAFHSLAASSHALHGKQALTYSTKLPRLIL